MGFERFDLEQGLGVVIMNIMNTRNIQFEKETNIFAWNTSRIAFIFTERLISRTSKKIVNFKFQMANFVNLISIIGLIREPAINRTVLTKI